MSEKDLHALATALRTGDTDAWLGAFSKAPRVNAQRGGVLGGPAPVSTWVEESAQWLAELDARYEPGLALADGDHLVSEGTFWITVKGEEVDLPFVMIADRDGERVSEIRTYHSQWPYLGTHAFRAPPTERREVDKIPSVFTDYIARISAAEVDTVLASFTDDGYVREPAGNRWKHAGKEGREAFYRHLENAPRATFDLRTCTRGDGVTVVEYAFAYGDVDMVGGVCVMEHDDERIHAVRITDDVAA
ncbi:MAG: hypothetical protein AB8I08_07920 [Sandaracinaceae bacterium]